MYLNREYEAERGVGALRWRAHGPEKLMRAELTAVVLAGGPGSRLGGGKPWRTLAGRRLVDLALEQARALCPQVVLAAADCADFADLSCTVVADRWPGQGPLAALVTVFFGHPGHLGAAFTGGTPP